MKDLRVSAYCPMISKGRRAARGAVKINGVMFPGYIFVYIDLEEHLYRLRSIPGVAYVLQIGGQIPIVPNRFIEELKECLESHEVAEQDQFEIKKGSMVLLDDSPLKGLAGRVSKITNGGERISIVLDLLGQQVSLSMPNKMASMLS